MSYSNKSNAKANKERALQKLVDDLELVQIRVHSAIEDWDVLSVYTSADGKAISIDIRRKK